MFNMGQIQVIAEDSRSVVRRLSIGSDTRTAVRVRNTVTTQRKLAMGGPLKARSRRVACERVSCNKDSTMFVRVVESMFLIGGGACVSRRVRIEAG